MLNVGNGNLVVQDDDVDVSERGIDLAFRQSYNSQSQHDYSGTDGWPGPGFVDTMIGLMTRPGRMVLHGRPTTEISA